MLPATFDPYNTVSYIEIILRNLHTRLITNSMPHTREGGRGGGGRERGWEREREGGREGGNEGGRALYYVCTYIEGQQSVIQCTHMYVHVHACFVAQLYILMYGHKDCYIHVFVCVLEQLEMEGSLQAYVHNTTKYDDCELANFPHVKTRLTCLWACAGKEPHNHHAVRRCAPDKMPVLPDKQVCTVGAKK